MNTKHLKKQVSIVSFMMFTIVPATNRISKKVSLLILGSIFFIFNASAQVTIGADSSPDKHAILELKAAGDSKGLLFPGIPLVDLASYVPFVSNDIPAGMLVYNTGTAFQKGLYTWNGSRWELAGSNWFYMPAAPFATDFTSATNNSKDLYAVYEEQFSASNPRSTNAPAISTQISKLERTDFYYYVISYDNTVFSNIVINENGVMTYDLLKDGDDSTYINIIFVRKN
jgi:hypothetical protein